MVSYTRSTSASDIFTDNARDGREKRGAPRGGGGGGEGGGGLGRLMWGTEL